LIFGAGLTAGIGFTMSIFITSLSFKEPLLLDTSKIAIIAGSVLSGLAGRLCFIGFGGCFIFEIQS